MITKKVLDLVPLIEEKVEKIVHPQIKVEEEIERFGFFGLEEEKEEVKSEIEEKGVLDILDVKLPELPSFGFFEIEKEKMKPKEKHLRKMKDLKEEKEEKLEGREDKPVEVWEKIDK